MLYLLGFLCLNVIQLPYYCNVVADGSAIEADAVTIAKMVNERGYSRVYYLIGAEDRYEQAVYAYQKAETIAVTEDELTSLDLSGQIVIASVGTIPPSDLVSLDLPLQDLRVYQIQ